MKTPIRFRLAAAYCSVFLVMIGALEVAAYLSVRAAIHSIVDHELESRLEGVVDHLDRHITKLPWPELYDSLKTHAAFQPEFLLMRRTGGETMFQGRAMGSVAKTRYAATPSLATLTTLGHVLRVLSVRRTIRGTSYDLALATDLMIPSAVLSRLWLLMLLSLPVLVLAALAAGYWIAGRALQPVTCMIAAAQSIDSHRLSERIAVPNTGDEIQQLAETMNGMLARIESGFRQVRDFTANASHELRTPLGIIRATAEVALLARYSGSESYRESLKRILREAERNSTLLEDLMALARADSGTDRLNRTRVDLAESVRQACLEAHPLAEAAGIDLQLKPAANIWIDGDAAHLRRLWLILLDNAVKYTPAGGKVWVEASTDGTRAFYRIADSGIGIPAEHRSRIFERFYRVDKARSREHRGTGLGLSIAKQIADLHGATIEATSEPGLGAVFTVAFACCRIVAPLQSARKFETLR